ncbi:MAG: hypothetical protein WA347_07055 [Rhabdochlamydiaceae bacterium]
MRSWTSAKAPGVERWQVGQYITNMDPLAIVQPRGFGAVQPLILGLMEH